MNAKSLKLWAVMFICILLMTVLSCKGSIESQIIFVRGEDDSTTESQDTWPCDTTTAIYICLFEKSQGLLECIEETMTIDAPIDDIPDTMSAYFGKLGPGDYYIGIFCEEPTEGTTMEKTLITWYHSDINSGELITEADSAETITISAGKNVNLGEIIIPIPQP